MGTSQTTGTPPPRPHPSDVDQHLDEYVRGELRFLSDRAKLFEKRANLWYRIVGVIMVLAVAFAIYRAYRSSMPVDRLSWQEVVRTIASSLIVIALLSGMARFAFIMGKSFMVEAIRNNNRRHAITFGQFYLKAFRDNITWPETRDAFRSWNIDIGSAFLGQNPEDIDPQLIQNLVAMANALGNKAK
jgi:predicted PurR-regulated permease PerM